jgi:hypothetical protein
MRRQHDDTANDVSALRNDNDPFILAAHLLPVLIASPAFLALPFVRWTSYSCPHCRSVFRRDFWPQNVRLGNGAAICKKCGQSFDEGSREWPQLPWGKKLRYFLPPGIQAVAGGGLFCVVFTFFIAPRDVIDWQFVVILPLTFLSPVLIWYLVRSYFVIRSTRRFWETGASGLSSSVQS